MASLKSQEASSSNFRCTYHVFLSFRGEDTRKKFTDHLYTALVQAGFRTFRDDDEIRRGENIELEIRKAIQGSKMSVIVFSKDYASSRWCLDELAMIMERKKLVGHHVVPVFYDVDPSQVRMQTGSFAEAFVRHEERFKEEKRRVEGWSEALREVADLEGMELRDGYEPEFVKNIVKEVGSKLSRTVLFVAPNLVGIESRVEPINLWLQDGSNDVRIAAIYGMGGVGKTTAAKIVYNMNFNKFDGSSFLANVKQMSEQSNGLVQLQRKFLSDLLRQKADKIYNVDEGIMKIRKIISCKRVLLIMDDVDQIDQFSAIIGMKKWFYPGSKIIVTTRHEHFLMPHEVNMMFKIKELDDNESLQLFSWHAFRQDHPVHGYKKHSKNVVHHCGGLPLALQVLGSSLFGRTTNVWESAIQKLEEILDSKIQKILKISYDSLQDDHDRSLFLDIACFFVGMEIGYIATILDGCNFSTTIGIQDLVDRCLITITEDRKLMMHQLVRDMGREIVRQESYDNPGKRSRIWNNKDAFSVLSENTGTKLTRGLSLNLSMLMEEKHAPTIATDNYSKRRDVEDSADELMLPHQGNCSKRHRLSFFSWKPVRNALISSLSTKAFLKMQNMKFLNLSDINLNGSYKDFSKSLVWLRWQKFSLNSIPNDLCLEKLVVLDMHNSNLKNVWKGIRFARELKILDLSHSHGLFRTPNFIGIPSLERLVLKDCINLIEVDESIGDLQRLVSINLKDCESLKKLPAKMNMLKSLEELILSGCSSLGDFPKELMMLELDETALNQVQPSKNLWKIGLSFWHSTFYSWLLPRRCSQSSSFSLAFFPSSLITLSLADCGVSDNAITVDFSSLPSLQELNLTGNPIYYLPESIKSLNMLKRLTLERCQRLQSLPELPSNLIDLMVYDCASLERIRNHPTNLYVIGCENLVEVPGKFKLEPIRNTNKEMLNNLGLVNLESLESIAMESYNSFTWTEMKTTIQASYQTGMLSIFLPGSEIPDWCSIQKKGSSLSFDVLPVFGHKLCSMNLCSVYAYRICKERTFNKFDLSVCIKNKTKNLLWRYFPVVYGIPKPNMDILWLSQLMLGDQFEEGDQVQVTVDSTPKYASPKFQINKCGIRLIYEQEESSNSSTQLQNKKIGLHYRLLEPWDDFLQSFYYGNNEMDSQPGPEPILIDDD